MARGKKKASKKQGKHSNHNGSSEKHQNALSSDEEWFATKKDSGKNARFVVKDHENMIDSDSDLKKDFLKFSENDEEDTGEEFEERVLDLPSSDNNQDDDDFIESGNVAQEETGWGRKKENYHHDGSKGKADEQDLKEEAKEAARVYKQKLMRYKVQDFGLEKPIIMAKKDGPVYIKNTKVQNNHSDNEVDKKLNLVNGFDHSEIKDFISEDSSQSEIEDEISEDLNDDLDDSEADEHDDELEFEEKNAPGLPQKRQPRSKLLCDDALLLTSTSEDE